MCLLSENWNYNNITIEASYYLNILLNDMVMFHMLF